MRGNMANRSRHRELKQVAVKLPDPREAFRERLRALIPDAVARTTLDVAKRLEPARFLQSQDSRLTNRYQIVPEEKAGGATYTPKLLSDFVARQIVKLAKPTLGNRVIRVLDPAVGDGELLVSLLQELGSCHEIEVHGFETDKTALAIASTRLGRLFPNILVKFQQKNFLQFVIEYFGANDSGSLFAAKAPESFDLIIANPPYVRTQIMGTRQAQLLAQQFGLSGRVDLYYAFLIAMARVLKPQGTAGIIVSNRFMTTKSGSPVRAAIRNSFSLRHVWDLGDTKLFQAAVLPAVLLVEGKNSREVETPAFTSIYETDAPANHSAADPIAAMDDQGVIALSDGRRFRVQHGKLATNGGDNAIWRLTTQDGDSWLATVGAHTWGTFRDIGKIRVGVKTCADGVFIRSDWETLPANKQPELLRSLTTHHVARRFKALASDEMRRILYPHKTMQGRRQSVDLSQYPRSHAYLESHRQTLEARKYVLQAGRSWFEIWVPQDPSAWVLPKLVFRDISEKPTFWIDQDATVINGDCYWMLAERPGTDDLLWLAAAVANSTFAETFYDHQFNNKLYSGRRRFMTQYVERFPLPNPKSPIGQYIIDTAKAIYSVAGTPKAAQLESTLDKLIWQAFGLSVKESDR